MIISKRVVVLLGIVCIFLFAFLNRIRVIQKSDVVNVYAQRLSEDKEVQYSLSYTYKGASYKYIVDNDIFLKNKTTYRLLIVNKNPEDFVVFNFMGFWFVTLLVSCVLTSAWLLIMQAFYDNVVSFKLLFGKEKKEEIEDE